MQTLDFVPGLNKCPEFSQTLSCLYQAMQTKEKSFLLLKSIRVRELLRGYKLFYSFMHHLPQPVFIRRVCYTIGELKQRRFQTAHVNRKCFLFFAFLGKKSL